jgi:O-acetyl-ADP-ribose deacetylase (regulator of RNase III)
MHDEYRKRCKFEPRQFNLGDCWLWKADKQPWVFNLGTQEGYWRARASYEAIETALRSMRKLADLEGVARIAIPRIGVGYGGLSWKKVRAIVEAVFEDWSGTLVVYEEYVAGDSVKSVAMAESGIDRTSPRAAVSTRSESRTTRPRSTGSSVTDSEKTGNDEGDTIRFYSVNAEFGCFSNFSPYPILLKGKTWPTSEHYFQAQKFAGTSDEEEVRQAKSPMVAA